MPDEVQATEQSQPTTDPTLIGGPTTTEPESPSAESDAKLESTEGEGETKPESAEGEVGVEAIELKLPEGFDAAPELDEFKSVAQELGLKSDGAQKLFDLYAKHVASQNAALQQNWEKTNQGWIDEIKNDKEIGGARLDRTLQDVGRMLDMAQLSDGTQIFGREFREALNFTGAGNHPAIARSLARLASLLVEGSSVRGAPPARDGQGRFVGQRPSPAQALYGPDGPHTGGPKLAR